jgi:hypothetical protein
MMRLLEQLLLPASCLVVLEPSAVLQKGLLAAALPALQAVGDTQDRSSAMRDTQEDEGGQMREELPPAGKRELLSLPQPLRVTWS